MLCFTKKARRKYYSFDITKDSKIFDHLLMVKFIKLT